MTKIHLNRESVVIINHIRDGSIHPRSETFENETTNTPFKLQYIYGETTVAEGLLEGSEELLLLPPSSSSPLLSSLEYEDQTVKTSSQPSASVVSTLLPSVGKGYYSLYSGTKRNRQYGTKSTIDSLTKIGEEWSKRNPDEPRIGVGDISKHAGGKLPPHKSHTRGMDVDIRPIRADKVEGRTNWKEASYSQKLTRELIQLMRMHADIRLIFFNDPTLVKAGLTLHWPGHDNHLHVRFKELMQTSVDTKQEYFRGPDEITPAWEGERELNTAQGKTFYLPTKQDSSSTLFRKVGIFIPSSFQPSAAVDLIIYFHGHIIPACKTCPSEFIKKGIEYYWNTSLFKCLREDLVASGQNAILVAPTLKPIFASKNNSPRDYGSLNEAGNFDILVNNTLTELQKRGELPVSTQVRNIILSGHSGGGLPMQAILNARNAMKKNIAECLGFECLYFGTSTWESWLKGNPNCHFRHFRRNTQFIPPTKALNKYANFIDVKDGTNHCSIVKEKWRQAIEGSNVLRGRGGGRSPEFPLINREVSGLTSLLSGLPGLTTLPFSFMTALMGGFQDENQLTNLIFFARHPRLGGRKLTSSDPQSLKDEWMSILKTIVRPAIRRMKEAGAKSSAESIPTMTPAKSISPVIDSLEDSKFYLTELKLYDKKIEVTSAGDRKKGMAVIIEEAPSIFLPKIIGMARDIALKKRNNTLAEKLDPTTWFKKFTTITFLGRLLQKDQYLHLEMAKLLKGIENEFVKKYGGDARSVGNMLLNNSNEGISGSRKTSTTATFSMHMFGLAVDVNYCGNPYIQSPNDIRALNTVLKKAALLMNEPVLDYNKQDLKDLKSNFDKVFDRVQQMDVMLEKYFSLLDMPDRLSSYLQGSSSSEWHGLSAADARTRIQKHLSDLAGFLSRVNKCGVPFFKKHGILDFDKRFVLQMTKQGLDWGAWYGDMMHFDMRSSGVGEYINLARLAYANKVQELAKQLFKEKRYGTHSP